MPEYEEIEKSIEVPKGAGIEGYVRVVEGLLKMGRVQEINIRIGSVHYRRFMLPGEPEHELSIDLESLLPYHVIRNNEIQEIVAASGNAAVVVSQLFGAVSLDGLNPVAFVSGPGTVFWEWHGRSTGVLLGRDEAYGVPFLTDQEIPNDVLILCAAYSREGKLIDTRRSYKVNIAQARTA